MSVKKGKAMKKVILKKRLLEKGEKEKRQDSNDQKREKIENTFENKTDEDNTNDTDTDMDTVEIESGNLIIDESRDEEGAQDPRNEVERKGEVKRSATMFTGVPENMITRRVRQVVPCKENESKRYLGKKVGFSRAQLHEKRGGTYKKEHTEYIRALMKVDRDQNEEDRDFNYIYAKNEGINQTNGSTRGRFLVSSAARIKDIGDYLEDIDHANGNQKVKITMVGITETKMYVVDQGQNNREGQEILTVFTREEIQRKQEEPRAMSSPVAGCSWWRPG